MKFLSAFSGAVAALASSGLVAQGPAVERGAVPSWVEEIEPLPVPQDAAGMIFVRRSDTLVHLDTTGQSSFLAQHYAILHPQALQAGNVAIIWNPATGNPVVHRLNIHRDGEIIDVLELADFEILRREDQLEEAILDGTLTAILRVPDLRVGDELDLAYTVRSSDPTLGDMNFGVLFMSDNPPPGRIRLGLNWIDGHKPVVSVPPALEPFLEKGANSLAIRTDDAPQWSPPKDAPPRYIWGRIAEFSDFASWGEVVGKLGPLYVKAARLSADSPVRREAERIAQAHPTDRARAQAALELVQRQVRYIYVGLNGGNLTPADAETTWNRRYGDCKGKTALLLALLNEMDIEAYHVLAHNAGGDDGLDERLPSPAAFDHVLVQAMIDGKTWWLDGTLPDVAEMNTDPVFPYRWVLPLAGGGKLVAVDQKPFALPQEMGLFEIDARAGFDKPARKVSTTVKRGIAALAEYFQHSALTQQQIETGYRNALVGSSEWDDIERITYRFDRPTQASVLTIEGTGRVDWDDEGDGAFDLALPGGGFSPPERKRRPASQDQKAPFYNAPQYTCYATTVRLPEGTDIANWGFNSVFDTMLYGQIYYRMMEKRDDMTIRMVRGSRVDRTETTPEKAEKDNDRLDEFDNSKAVISYDPDREMHGWGRLFPVPAVYDFDWIGPDAPCLPEDVLDD